MRLTTGVTETWQYSKHTHTLIIADYFLLNLPRFSQMTYFFLKNVFVCMRTPELQAGAKNGSFFCSKFFAAISPSPHFSLGYVG